MLAETVSYVTVGCCAAHACGQSAVYFTVQAIDAMPWPKRSQHAQYQTGHSAGGAASCVVIIIIQL